MELKCPTLKNISQPAVDEVDHIFQAQVTMLSNSTTFPGLIVEIYDAIASTPVTPNRRLRSLYIFLAYTNLLLYEIYKIEYICLTSSPCILSPEVW